MGWFSTLKSELSDDLHVTQCKSGVRPQAPHAQRNTESRAN